MDRRRQPDDVLLPTTKSIHLIGALRNCKMLNEYNFQIISFLSFFSVLFYAFFTFIFRNVSHWDFRTFSVACNRSGIFLVPCIQDNDSDNFTCIVAAIVGILFIILNQVLCHPTWLLPSAAASPRCRLLLEDANLS